MDMLIDGGWTGASDGVSRPGAQPRHRRADRHRAARDRRRCRARSRRGAARQGRDGGDAGLPALRNPRGGRAAHRGEPGRARHAALPRERQAHRRDDQRGRRRGAHLPRLCRGGEAHLRPLGPAEFHPRPREVAGDHDAPAARRRRGDRAVQLSGGALEPQGRRRARRRQRGHHQDAGGLPARGHRDQPLPGGGRPAARRASACHRRARGRRGAGRGRRRADDRHDRLDRRRQAHPRSRRADAEEGASRTRRQRRDHRLRRRRCRCDRRCADRRALHLRQRPDLLRSEARAGRAADLSDAARRGCRAHDRRCASAIRWIRRPMSGR